MAPTGTPSARPTSRATPTNTSGRKRPRGRGGAAAPRRRRAAPCGLGRARCPRRPGAGRRADQDDGERTGRRLVEADLELVVDLGRQGLVAEDLEGAELGQHDQPDQDRAPEDGQAGLTHGDGPERPDPAQAEAARHLLLRRVRRPQAGRDRKEDQRIDGQRHHQHGGPEAGDGGEDGLPSEAHDEVRDAERNHDEDGQETATRNVRPLDEPRGQRADDGAQRRSPRRQATRCSRSASRSGSGTGAGAVPPTRPGRPGRRETPAAAAPPPTRARLPS